MASFNNFPYALRSLRKSPGFALTSILTLALGIGITSAIFSVVYGVLIKPLPYLRPDRLCVIWKSVPKKNLDRDWTSYPTYQDWRRDAGSFQDLAAFLRPDGSIVNLATGDNVEQLQSAKVSSNFFTVLGTRATLGRVFTPEDVSRNPSLAVLSHAFWKQHFGAAPDVIGRKLEIDQAPFEVIGVMPADFAFPANDAQT